MSFDYTSAPLPVRDDLLAAHQRYWRRLGEPGTHWMGAERVAIAREARAARDCALCQSRKSALSPYAPGAANAANEQLSAATVDTVHRIVTDAARLTARWFEGVVPGEMSDGHYVELVGTVVAVVSIDSFCLGLGLDPHPLPIPVPGAPSGYRPASLEMDGAWLPLVPLDNSNTPESDLWIAGQTGYVIRAMSLVPDEVRTLNDLSAAHYMANVHVRDASYSRGALTRSQTELVAGRVSMQNGCYY